MAEGRQSPLNLNSLLAAVEAAPPVAAVDVLAAALAEAIGAREVSFLIADFSGRSLIRLGHSGGKGLLRLQGKETAERVPLVGTPHGRALAAQAVEVVVEDGGARLFAPLTSRGEAVGVLELGLEDFPLEQTGADVARRLRSALAPGSVVASASAAAKSVAIATSPARRWGQAESRRRRATPPGEHDVCVWVPK